VKGRGNLIVAIQQNNLAVLYSYCNSFFIRDVRGDFGLINVHLFHIFSAILSRKVGIFFGLESVNPVCVCMCLCRESSLTTSVLKLP